MSRNLKEVRDQEVRIARGRVFKEGKGKYEGFVEGVAWFVNNCARLRCLVWSNPMRRRGAEIWKGPV